MNKFTKAIVSIALLSNGVNAFTASRPHNVLHTKKSAGVDLKQPSSFLSRAGLEKDRSFGTHTIILSKPETKLFAQNIEEPAESDNLLPSAFFLASAASLVKLAVDINASDTLPDTIGTWALFYTTLAVGWDNLIIGLGKPLFGDAENNESKFNILKTLSYPRFTAHAVLVPFLYATDAEIGKAMGVEWLQGDLVQTAMVVAAAVLAIVSRVNFVNSSGIEIADTSDSPPEALERSLLWFTYKEPTFLYVIPAILLAILNLYIGVTGLGGESQEAAIYMLIAGAAVLYGNAKPSYVMRFSGNLVEVVMLWFIFEAAQITL